MMTKRNKVIFGVGATVIIIAALLLFWYEIKIKEEHVTPRKKRDDSIAADIEFDEYVKSIEGSKVRNIDKPCSGSGEVVVDEIYLCVNASRLTTVVSLDLNKIEIGGYPGSAWAGYDWYMASRDYSVSWNNVFAYTGDSWKPNPTKRHRAQYWAKVMHLGKINKELKIIINTTNNPIPFENDVPCFYFSLWIEKSGNDPYKMFSLCQNFTESSNTAPGIMVAGPHSTKLASSEITVFNAEGDDVDELIRITTGVTSRSNNWLLMIEQAAKVPQGDCVVCMGPRPLLRVVPATLPNECLIPLMNTTNPTGNCSVWDEVYPLSPLGKNRPVFSRNVARNNFTCIQRSGNGPKLGTLTAGNCSTIVNVTRHFHPLSRSDIWWWCGDNRLFDKLPSNTTGLCTVVTLLLPVSIYPMTVPQLLDSLGNVLPSVWHQRQKRSLKDDDDPTYIDSIGVPRGVPDEYKLVNQIYAGFESSICWWCTINKNVDRINYIHYNVQRLGNKTEQGFSAVHEQLSATSLMAFQNRIAVDMLLAERGGVCALFGEQCCTFIPNNTAADGSLTKALDGLRALNSKMKDHSGADTEMWDGLGNVFGRYQ
uniref:Uncharacterized protein n=1 Tax=Poecilia reticulata TaxID=8081 RepID=A0A3P9NK73_POERE